MRVGRRPGLPAPESPSLELCPSAGVDSWPGLTASVGVSPRQGHHLSLAPQPPNGTRITCRAGPCKTNSTPRPATHAKAPMQRRPIGPVGFMQWLCALSSIKHVSEEKRSLVSESFLWRIPSQHQRQIHPIGGQRDSQAVDAAAQDGDVT